MGATAWAEQAGIQGGFQEGMTSGTGADDYFIDPLFEGTAFFAVLAPAYSEMSVAATAHTEMSIAATPWTELT